MRLRSLASCLVLSVFTLTTSAANLGSARPESAGVSSQRLQRLTDGMQQLVRDGHVAGVVTMVARGDKVIHFEAAGKQSLEDDAPMQRDSIFRIYSMTKPITGVAMMLLLEEGKWQLNDPVSKHIPEFANLKVAEINPATGVMTQVPQRRPMLMRDLMSHTAGFTYGVFGNTPVDRLYTQVNVMDPNQPLQSMIDKLAKTPLLFQPGERWHYSVAVDIQGYLVEKLSGQSFPDFLRTRLFEPLGMKDTAFYVPPEKRNRFAAFYTYDTAGKLVPQQGPDYAAPPALPSGGGGLVSTASACSRRSPCDSCARTCCPLQIQPSAWRAAVRASAWTSPS
jgi:CubicO group peptidase (beta-lactamase class C family)